MDLVNRKGYITIDDVFSLRRKWMCNATVLRDTDQTPANRSPRFKASTEHNFSRAYRLMRTLEARGFVIAIANVSPLIWLRTRYPYRRMKITKSSKPSFLSAYRSIRSALKTAMRAKDQGVDVLTELWQPVDEVARRSDINIRCFDGVYVLKAGTWRMIQRDVFAWYMKDLEGRGVRKRQATEGAMSIV